MFFILLSNATIQASNQTNVILYPNLFQIIAIIISLIAIVFSVLSFWKNYLSPFKLEVTYTTPRFKLYKITPEMSGNKDGKSWWIPSFDMGISFYNTGQQTGKVRDVRILVEFTPNKNKDEKIENFAFYPRSIVKTNAFHKNIMERFEWIHEAVIGEWHPIILGAKGSKELHLVLEIDYRWDEKKYGNIKFRIEVLSSESDEWKKYNSYTLENVERYFDMKSAITTNDPEIDKFRKTMDW